MRELGLAEVLEPIEGEDGRTKTHRLSLVGERVIARLHAQALPRWGEQLIELVARAFTTMASSRRLSLGDLESWTRASMAVPAPPAKQLAGHIARIAMERAFVRRIEGQEVLVATELTAQSRLAAELERMVRGGDPGTVMRGCLDKLSRNQHVYVRCEHRKDWWNMVLSGRHFADFPEARTIDSQDIQCDAVPPPAENMAVVYADLLVLRKDEQEAPAMRKLAAAARTRLCFGVEGAELPNGYGLVPVEA
jgi:hypothetical protein